jgi:RNA recognition motif-containing protein
VEADTVNIALSVIYASLMGLGGSLFNYYYTPGRRNYSPPTHSRNRIEIENLSTGVSWQDLKDYFRKAGEVCFADAHRHRGFYLVFLPFYIFESFILLEIVVG